MKLSPSSCLLIAGTIAIAGCAAESLEPELETVAAPLTLNDVDLPPECQGILGYVNTATYAALDAYLPSNVASAIVARRNTARFVSLMDLSSVSGVAQARLSQITAAARAENWIGPSCAGVYEELAVSTDDVSAILSYVNSVSQAALTPVLRFEASVVAPIIIAARPITSMQQLADLYGVGLETFRSIRDAAIVTPFDLLVASVNAVHRDAALTTAFDLYGETAYMPGQPTGLTCFGPGTSWVTQLGGTYVATPAPGSEVLAQVTYAVNYANRYGGVTGIAAGLADLTTQVTDQTFYGCYFSFSPDPWSGVNRAAFVNTKTGYRVLAETRWVE